jgi:hypothetical protein
VIDETWTVDEILDAQSLDELEGVGQAKRLTARLCAEIHNAIRNASWGAYGSKGSQPPERMDESLFLPVRRKHDENQSDRDRDELVKSINATMSSMCGY